MLEKHAQERWPICADSTTTSSYCPAKSIDVAIWKRYPECRNANTVVFFIGTLCQLTVYESDRLWFLLELSLIQRALRTSKSQIRVRFVEDSKYISSHLSDAGCPPLCIL